MQSRKGEWTQNDRKAQIDQSHRAFALEPESSQRTDQKVHVAIDGVVEGEQDSKGRERVFKGKSKAAGKPEEYRNKSIELED